MRVVVHRVLRSSVWVYGRIEGEIGAGLLVLLGIALGDGEDGAAQLAGRVARLRVFENDAGRLDRSLLDTGGAALVVSQYTLIAESRRHKATRPDFSKAARPELAEPLYERFCEELRRAGATVATGVFGARMQVELVNDGPVTIILET
jgi:D-tyrosyl-tRNA(Tyr) deacylase